MTDKARLAEKAKADLPARLRTRYGATGLNILNETADALDVLLAENARSAEAQAQMYVALANIRDQHEPDCFAYRQAAAAIGTAEQPNDPARVAMEARQRVGERNRQLREENARLEAALREARGWLGVIDCARCEEEEIERGDRSPFARFFIICPSCGNKRCPKATDHCLDCTGSNEPGQPGSRYAAVDRSEEPRHEYQGVEITPEVAARVAELESRRPDSFAPQEPTT